MFDTRLSRSRSSRRLSTCALVGAALLAACDTDAPTVPNSTLPTDASPARLSGPGKTATLVIRMIDQNNNVIPALGPSSARFTVEEKGQPPFDVADNGKRDADMTVGIVRVSGLAAGTYVVCQTTAPTGRVLPASPCATITLFGGGNGSLDFINLLKARVQWRTVDYLGNLLAGAEFVFIDPNGDWELVIDNQWPDLDPTLGKVEVQADVEGVYQVCQSGEPPSGYIFLPNQTVFCWGVPLKHGETATGPTFTLFPQFGLYWGVAGGAPDSTSTAPIGGAAFTVTGSLTTMTVVDNGANDVDPRVGRLAVNLTGEGGYTICQTVVPAGYSAPSPVCMSVQVYEGDPNDGGWFYDLPI